MKLVGYFAVLALGVACAQLCETPCDDPCTVEVEGSDITVDLVGASGQIKIFRSDEEKNIKLSLEKIEERDSDGKKTGNQINNLASIDAEWCAPESDGNGDDEEVSIVLLADAGDVDLRAVINLNNAVTKSRCCFSGEDLCIDPVIRATTPEEEAEAEAEAEVPEAEDDTLRDPFDCSGISDDCLIDDCSECTPSSGDSDGEVTVENPDGDDEDVACDAERVALADSAFKWSIDLDGWACDGDDTTVNFGWKILSAGASSGSFDDCDGCSDDGCSDVAEVTCDFDGGSVSLPTTVTLADGDADVTSIEFDGHGSNFVVTVAVPCSDHIEYDPDMDMDSSAFKNSLPLTAFALAALAFGLLWN